MTPARDDDADNVRQQTLAGVYAELRDLRDAKQRDAVTLERMGGHLATLRDDLTAIKHTLEGNGKPGLKTEVDRLTRSQATQTKLIWVIVGALAAGAAAYVFDHAGPGGGAHEMVTHAGR